MKLNTIIKKNLNFLYNTSFLLHRQFKCFLLLWHRWIEWNFVNFIQWFIVTCRQVNYKIRIRSCDNWKKFTRIKWILNRRTYFFKRITLKILVTKFIQYICLCAWWNYGIAWVIAVDFICNRLLLPEKKFIRNWNWVISVVELREISVQ